MKTLITALTLVTLIAAAAPGFAQRSEQQSPMNAAREKALQECSTEAGKHGMLVLPAAGKTANIKVQS
jgi:hypothetical protein